MSFHQDFSHRSILTGSTTKPNVPVKTVFRDPLFTKVFNKLRNVVKPIFHRPENSLSTFTGQGPRGIFPPATTVWDNLKIGGGGFVTGIDLMSDGTKVARVDTYGAYLYNISTGLWQQLCTIQSMPASFSGLGKDVGSYELRVAPSNTNRFYMIMSDGNVFRTDNKGGTWVHLPLTPDTAVNTADAYRACGPFMAVNPVNADIVFLGTPTTGLSKSSNAGVSWVTDSGVPAPTSTTRGGVLVAYDPSDVTGNTVYAASYGNGVYKTTNGGTSWTKTTGTPTTCNHMIVDAAGIVWLVDDANANSSGTLNKFVSGSWTTAIAGTANTHSVAVDPVNGAHVFAGGSNCQLNISTNTGGSFVGPASFTLAATNIPWLAANSGLSNGNMVFDPQSGLLYLADGTGVWTTTPPTTNTPFAWTEITSGIENLDCNWVVSGASGGSVLVNCWDRPAFVLTSGTYPSKYGILQSGALKGGWSGDIDAAGDIIVSLGNNFGDTVDTSGYSSDNGMTWHQFSSDLPFTNTNHAWGGCIAASSSTRFVWIPDDFGSDTNSPWYTSNGGVSWTAVNAPGVPLSGTTGWGSNYYQARQNCSADRVTPDTFYMYNDTGSWQGIYKLTNGGATCVRVYSGGFGGGFGGAFQMRSVPGKAGHLFATIGNQGPPHPANVQLFQSTDGGATWNAIADVKEVYCVGFGKSAPGQSYPAIYIVGWVSLNSGATYNYGVWRSIDQASTWTNIGDGFPLGNYSTIKACEGDNKIYGNVYLVTGGSGAFLGKLQ